jgi:hypothetical protein
MNAESAPLPASEDLATERLVAVGESAAGGQNAKRSVFDGDAKASPATEARLLQLRNQPQGQQPCPILACWIGRPLGSSGAVPAQKDNGNHHIPNTNHNNDNDE